MQKQAGAAEEPQRSPQQQGRQQMCPEHSFSGHQREPQQSIEKRTAEQQIHEPCEPWMEAADAPENIIFHCQHKPQPCRQQEGPGLLDHRQLHQPNSLASRPVPLGVSSS